MAEKEKRDAKEALQKVSLQSFLLERGKVPVTQKLYPGKVFEDNGYAFTIKPVSMNDYNMAQAAAIKLGASGLSDFNQAAFNLKLIQEGCVEPNFRDAKFQADLKVADAKSAIQKTLLAGEIGVLSEAILGLSGFGYNVKEVTDELKND